MRVLIVFPKMHIYGGAEQLVVKLCNYLSATGIANAVLTTKITREIENDLKDTEIIVCPTHREGLNMLRLAIFIWKCVRKYRDKYDLVNVHNFPAELSAFCLNKPVVWMCNEPEVFLLKESIRTWKRKLLLNFMIPFDRYVVRHCIHESVVSDLFNESRFSKLFGKKPQIVPYGIDWQFFVEGNPLTTKSKLNLGGQFVILHAGMLTPFKNQLASLRALSAVKKSIPNVHLILAGSWCSEYKVILEDYIHQNSLEHQVTFTGHVDKEQMRMLFYACDILLHPIKSQGGWLVPFEAMCAELPVIVSRELTIARCIKEYDLGIVTDNYSTALLDVFQNYKFYREKAVTAKHWVKENLSWDKYGERMLRIFSQVYNKHANRQYNSKCLI